MDKQLDKVTYESIIHNVEFKRKLMGWNISETTKFFKIGYRAYRDYTDRGKIFTILSGEGTLPFGKRQQLRKLKSRYLVFEREYSKWLNREVQNIDNHIEQLKKYKKSIKTCELTSEQTNESD